MQSAYVCSAKLRLNILASTARTHKYTYPQDERVKNLWLATDGVDGRRQAVLYCQPPEAMQFIGLVDAVVNPISVRGPIQVKDKIPQRQ